MIDPSQNSESATSTNLLDQEERESHYHFIQRSSDWIELIHNKKPLNNMPHRNKYNDTPSDTSSNNTTPSNVNNNDSPDVTPLHIYLTTHKHGHHHMIHAKKDQPFAPSFLNDAGYESGSSSNDDDTAPSSACDEVTPAITTPVHFLTEQHHPFSPTTINKSSSTKEFPTSHNSDNVQKKRSRVASLPVTNQQEKIVTNNLPTITTTTNNDNTTISTTSQTPPTNIENPTAGLHHIQSQPNMLSNQPISLLSQSLLKQSDEHDFYMVNEEEVSSASALIGRQKYYSEVNLPSMDVSPLKSNSQLVKKPIIKHNIGKHHPEGTESWLLPGECVLNHIKKVGVVKNLPITYFPPTHSNPQAISTQGPFVEPPKQPSGEFLTTAEELLHDFNVYDLLNTVGSGSNSNYGSAGSTISTNGNATSINIGDQSDTEPTLVIGELYITNYQIRFQCIAKPSLILTTPTSSILTMAPKYPQSETNTYSNYYSQYISSNANNGPTTDNKFNSLGYISIKSKDLQVLKFLFFKDSSLTIEKVMEALKAATSKRVFAFAFRKHIATYPIQIYSQEDIEKGWKVYKMKREFKRQGLFTRYQTNPSISWRISNINSKFKICDTYPEHFVVPKDVSDEMLAASAAFRSKGRIPVLSWIHPHKNICIVRSSQPMVGITRARCKEDEELVDAIRRASGSERLQIIDCRPKANAWANTVMGKGYENIAYYTNCAIEFMNIENIHAMTNSLNLLKKLIQNKQNNDQYWLSSFEATGWLKHTKLIMQAASKVVTYIERFDTSVLVHCSDGWDRTAQICALAELLLDPFYRTIKGFQILIEREWVSFGHKFLDRVGHGCVGKTNSASDEISPVFLQFIDCVWQVWQQYPSHFEFNEAFLFLILDSLYSCRFGNFLLNCVKQQFDENITKDTISVWTEVMTNPALYHNDVYNPKNSEYLTLIVNTDIDTLSTHFWISYFYRYKKGSKNRYHRMLKKAISKMKKENAILLNSLQEEHMTRKRIEQELAQSKQKIKFLEGHNSLTDESHISDSYGSHAASDTPLSYNGEDGDTKVIRFSSSVKENLVENYFK